MRDCKEGGGAGRKGECGWHVSARRPPSQRHDRSRVPFSSCFFLKGVSGVTPLFPARVLHGSGAHVSMFSSSVSAALSACASLFSFSFPRPCEFMCVYVCV